MKKPLLGVLVFLLVFVSVSGYLWSKQGRRKEHRGQYFLLMNTARVCEVIKDLDGAYPRSKDDITAEHPAMASIGFRWDYIPFDAEKGYGALLSYGLDNKPGGKRRNADLEIRIPFERFS